MPIPVIVGTGAREIMKQIAITAATYGAGKALDAMIDPGPKFSNPDPGTPISQQPIVDIVNNITIDDSNNISPAEEQETQIALNTVAADAIGTQDLVTSLSATEFAILELLDNKVLAMTEGTSEMVGNNGLPDALDKKKFTPEAQKVLRKIDRADTDRWYCSKEEHEYRYAQSAGKIDQVFTLASQVKQHNGTYGTWVDSVPMRKAIAYVRKLRRLSHGKNAKAITAQSGTTRDELLESLASSAESQAILDAGCLDWNLREIV